MLSAPQAEFGLEALGNEVVIAAFEGSFQCDVSLALIDLQMQQLQAERPPALRDEAQETQSDAHGCSFHQATFGERQAAPHVERQWV